MFDGVVIFDYFSLVRENSFSENSGAIVSITITLMYWELQLLRRGDASVAYAEQNEKKIFFSDLLLKRIFRLVFIQLALFFHQFQCEVIFVRKF